MIFDTNLNIFLSNLLFLVAATSFLVFVGWYWRHAKPYTLPQPLPRWFKPWLYVVLVVGVLLPLVAMLVWGVWWNHTSVLQALVPYFAILGLQILSESLTLRRFQSCVWVMVPYLYVPYRVWQLYQGLTLVSLESELRWVHRLLVVEIVLWICNYGLDLSALPELFSTGSTGEEKVKNQIKPGTDPETIEN